MAILNTRPLVLPNLKDVAEAFTQVAKELTSQTPYEDFRIIAKPNYPMQCVDIEVERVQYLGRKHVVTDKEMRDGDRWREQALERVTYAVGLLIEEERLAREEEEKRRLEEEAEKA
jgi:hypothetical protein